MVVPKGALYYSPCFFCPYLRQMHDTGALLTGYVGVNGLIERMASDRCLPQFLLNRNKYRHTSTTAKASLMLLISPWLTLPLFSPFFSLSAHNIIFGYFLLASGLVGSSVPSSYRTPRPDHKTELCISLCTSFSWQVIILQGDVSDLSGVYSFAFLSVLTAFSIGVSSNDQHIYHAFPPPLYRILLSIYLIHSLSYWWRTYSGNAAQIQTPDSSTRSARTMVASHLKLLHASHRCVTCMM